MMSEEYLDFKGKEQVILLERVGSLQLLVILLQQGRMHVSKIIKRDKEDPGIATQNAMKTTRENLIEIGLIKEYEEVVPVTGARRTYVELTKKGGLVAQKAKDLAESLV